MRWIVSELVLRTDAMETSDESPEVSETHSRLGNLHLAFALDTEVARELAQRWDPRRTEKWSPVDGSPMEGVGAAISATVADQCNQSLGPKQNGSTRFRLARRRGAN